MGWLAISSTEMCIASHEMVESQKSVCDGVSLGRDALPPVSCAGGARAGGPRSGARRTTRARTGLPCCCAGGPQGSKSLPDMRYTPLLIAAYGTMPRSKAHKYQLSTAVPVNNMPIPPVMTVSTANHQAHLCIDSTEALKPMHHLQNNAPLSAPVPRAVI